MIPVDDLRLEKISVDKLKPHPLNPRVTLTEGMPMYEKLKKSIEKHTYIDPIIWNERTGYIVAGHQRLNVLKDLAEKEGVKLDKVSVIVVNLSDDDEKTFLLSDNKITGVWDPDKLKTMFEQLSEEEYEFTGFDEFEIESLLNEDPFQADDDDGGDFEEYDPEEMHAKHKCPKCGYEWN